MRGVPKALVQGDGDAGSTVEWETPNDLFDAADAEFGPFTMDPATSLGYHTSDVILSRPRGQIVTVDAHHCGASDGAGRVGYFAGICPHDDSLDAQPICEGDGLSHAWTGRVWLNHPYGREDWRWIKKAHDSVRYGDAEIVVALGPVKTQMKWWHKYVGAHFTGENPRPYGNAWGDHKANEIRFIRGRLRFGGAPSSAPFNSALIVWRK